MHLPGLTWSESPQIESFFGESGWAKKLIKDNFEGLDFMVEPKDCTNEFVTAGGMSPGQNPFLKPRDACSGITPLDQTCRTSN